MTDQSPPPACPSTLSPPNCPPPDRPGIALACNHVLAHQPALSTISLPLSNVSPPCQLLFFCSFSKDLLERPLPFQQHHHIIICTQPQLAYWHDHPFTHPPTGTCNLPIPHPGQLSHCWNYYLQHLTCTIQYSAVSVIIKN